MEILAFLPLFLPYKKKKLEAKRDGHIFNTRNQSTENFKSELWPDKENLSPEAKHKTKSLYGGQSSFHFVSAVFQLICLHNQPPAAQWWEHTQIWWKEICV